MARRPWQAWNLSWPMLAWTVLLASLPWWLGLPLLLALAAVLLVLPQRLIEHVPMIRRSLRWGLPGVLFGLQRALGGDAFAWGAALLGALVGYTLLAGLEAWLDRGHGHVPVTSASTSAEWPELALASIGPTADIIELQLPAWQPGDAGLTDPCDGSSVCHQAGGYRFAGDRVIDGVGPHVAFSPAGRWFVARMAHDRGVVLWDRERDRQHHLEGWQLCGWYREQPWLARRDGEMPLALSAVLGHDDENRLSQG
ncbi:hypothetical protein B0E50_10540 [Rhodanobacter sp. C01]|nr:hypothetical protein B0E50_10540 [Rhodanobacter sp. C01]